MTNQEFDDSLQKIAERLVTERKTNYDNGKLRLRNGRTKADIARAIEKAEMAFPKVPNTASNDLERHNKTVERLKNSLKLLLTEDKQKLIKDFREELSTIVKVYTKDDVCDENVIDAIINLCRTKGKCLDFLPISEKKEGD
jgi:hypothetical protein